MSFFSAVPSHKQRFRRVYTTTLSFSLGPCKETAQTDPTPFCTKRRRREFLLRVPQLTRVAGWIDMDQSRPGRCPRKRFSVYDMVANADFAGRINA